MLKGIEHIRCSSVQAATNVTLFGGEVESLFATIIANVQFLQCCHRFCQRRKLNFARLLKSFIERETVATGGKKGSRNSTE